MLALLVLTQAKFPMTIESIMRGPALVGHAPRGLRWSADGSELTFSWAKAEGKGDPPYRSFVVKRDGTSLVTGEGKPGATPQPAPPPTAFEKDGDLYYQDPATKQPVKLVTSTDGKFNPRLAPDAKSVVYVKGDAVYRIDIATGAITQLTYILAGDTMPANAPKGIVAPPKGYRSSGWSLSPDGTHASVDFNQFPQGVKRTQVPNYITASGTPELMAGYPKVGEPQAHSQSALVDLVSGANTVIAAPKPARVGRLQWSPNGKYAYATARSDDHKDEWIYGFDPTTNKVTTLWNEHDTAWVGGPGRSVVGWLPDSSAIYFESEQNGYANLYSIPPSGGTPKALVGGNFEVSDLRLDADRKRFTFVSSEGSPFKRHVDTVNFDGTGKRKLADLSADEDAVYSISPNGQDVAVVRSTANRPCELFVNNVQVTHTPTSEWLTGPWIDPPIVMVPSTDGVKVPAHLFKPTTWKKGGPAVLFVHGAGYLQNVYDGWSHYFREYMFHHYLMSRGYAVLDMDYRGSAGYGKAWRTAIYRHMGGKDLDDEVAGAKYMVSALGAAPNRVGIYGGSYGGFMTLMAMFKAPNTFASGAALRPVSDWSNYNHGYTSEILNNPQDDKEAYQQSSPINFASGLKGDLLICHGVVDTNVHYEDSVKLIQKLIELGKKHWEIAPYPLEDHAFTRPSSWTDEYQRISDLFDRTIGPNRK